MSDGMVKTEAGGAVGRREGGRGTRDLARPWFPLPATAPSIEARHTILLQAAAGAYNWGGTGLECPTAWWPNRSTADS